MNIPEIPVVSPDQLPEDPSAAASALDKMADQVEWQLREELTETRHPSAIVAWILKGPAAVGIIQNPNEGDPGQNMIREEASRRGLTVLALSEDIARRYRRFMAFESILTGERGAITDGLLRITSSGDEEDDAKKIEDMCNLFNTHMELLWVGIGEAVLQ